MTLLANGVINMYSVLLLIVMLYYTNRSPEKRTLQFSLFMNLMRVTIVLLTLDTIARFDGNPGTYYSVFNHLGNFVMFAIQPTIASIWILYAHLNIFHDEKATQKIVRPLVLFCMSNFILVVINLKTGWFYHIDGANIYHRGPFYIISLMYSLGQVLFAFAMIIKNRRLLDSRHYYSLLFFAVPPLASILLQYLFYGYSLMLNAIVISLLIILLSIQNQSIYTDYLTGIYNRKWLDYYIKMKITASSERSVFSVILLDLDNFKNVNDTYGHDTGDRVLQEITKVLQRSLGKNSHLARYGGDEFYVIVNIENQTDLSEVILQLRRGMEAYNRESGLDQILTFSIGSIQYDPKQNWTVNEFQKRVDELLYLNKANKQKPMSKSEVEVR